MTTQGKILVLENSETDGTFRSFSACCPAFPILKPTKTVVTRILATIPAARETPDRARGATVAQLSVKVEALCRRERSGSLQPKSPFW